MAAVVPDSVLPTVFAFRRHLCDVVEASIDSHLEFLAAMGVDGTLRGMYSPGFREFRARCISMMKSLTALNKSEEMDDFLKSMGASESAAGILSGIVQRGEQDRYQGRFGIATWGHVARAADGLREDLHELKETLRKIRQKPFNWGDLDDQFEELNELLELYPAAWGPACEKTRLAGMPRAYPIPENHRLPADPTSRRFFIALRDWKIDYERSKRRWGWLWMGATIAASIAVAIISFGTLSFVAAAVVTAAFGVAVQVPQLVQSINEANSAQLAYILHLMPEETVEYFHNNVQGNAWAIVISVVSLGVTARIGGSATLSTIGKFVRTTAVTGMEGGLMQAANPNTWQADNTVALILFGTAVGAGGGAAGDLVGVAGTRLAVHFFGPAGAGTSVAVTNVETGKVQMGRVESLDIEGNVVTATLEGSGARVRIEVESKVARMDTDETLPPIDPDVLRPKPVETEEPAPAPRPQPTNPAHIEGFDADALLRQWATLLAGLPSAGDSARMRRALKAFVQQAPNPDAAEAGLRKLARGDLEPSFDLAAHYLADGADSKTTAAIRKVLDRMADSEKNADTFAALLRQTEPQQMVRAQAEVDLFFAHDQARALGRDLITTDQLASLRALSQASEDVQFSLAERHRMAAATLKVVEALRNGRRLSEDLLRFGPSPTRAQILEGADAIRTLDFTAAPATERSGAVRAAVEALENGDASPQARAQAAAIVNGELGNSLLLPANAVLTQIRKSLAAGKDEFGLALFSWGKVIKPLNDATGQSNTIRLLPTIFAEMEKVGQKYGLTRAAQVYNGMRFTADVGTDFDAVHREMSETMHRLLMNHIEQLGRPVAAAEAAKFDNLLAQLRRPEQLAEMTSVGYASTDIPPGFTQASLRNINNLSDLPEDQVGQLLDLFFRLDQAVTRAATGPGRFGGTESLEQSLRTVDPDGPLLHGGRDGSIYDGESPGRILQVAHGHVHEPDPRFTVALLNMGIRASRRLPAEYQWSPGGTHLDGGPLVFPSKQFWIDGRKGRLPTELQDVHDALRVYFNCMDYVENLAYTTTDIQALVRSGALDAIDNGQPLTQQQSEQLHRVFSTAATNYDLSAAGPNMTIVIDMIGFGGDAMHEIIESSRRVMLNLQRPGVLVAELQNTGQLAAVRQAVSPRRSPELTALLNAGAGDPNELNPALARELLAEIERLPQVEQRLLARLLGNGQMRSTTAVIDKKGKMTELANELRSWLDSQAGTGPFGDAKSFVVRDFIGGDDMTLSVEVFDGAMTRAPTAAEADAIASYIGERNVDYGFRISSQRSAGNRAHTDAQIDAAEAAFGTLKYFEVVPMEDYARRSVQNFLRNTEVTVQVNGTPRTYSMELLGFAEGSKPTVTAYGGDAIITRPQADGSATQDRIPMSAFAEMMSALKKHLHTLH